MGRAAARRGFAPNFVFVVMLVVVLMPSRVDAFGAGSKFYICNLQSARI